MDTLNEFLTKVSGIMWGYPMILLLMGTHILLTIRLRLPQRHLLKAIRLSLSKDKESTGEVSQFGALATALAATIGTGNIVGVGTAIALGGPGAVFWCWITGVLGVATKYGEGLLAVKYRINANGRMLGGPMYAIENGLVNHSKGVMRWFWKVMAIAFAFFTAFATFGIGSTVQANAIATMSYEAYGVSPVLVGGIVTILAAAVIMGGVKSIAKCCQTLVPLMAGFYILGCIVILCFNSAYIGEALKLIVVSAFEPSAAGGGFVGASIMLTARYGIARGLFSNESGLGSAPIIAAAAQTKNPVRQALVSSTGTFWDTVVICAITGITIVSSILAYSDINISDGGELTQMAFSKIPYVGKPLLAFGSLTFAFSTILGWGLYGERGMEFLADKWIRYKKGNAGFTSEYFDVKLRKVINAYRIVFLISVYLGAVVSLDLVWNLADIFNALMAIPNLLCLIFLSNVIVEETRKYLWNDNLNQEDKRV
ncbi:MAG: sodium:alanine symporter family protein [Parabacteroides distasonis]|nr:sodium:alanine symporter family protein [Parabacteroides distasonis]MBQ4163123.1 sodium:alanine symporter family protein [Parabacteroides sp.]